MKKERYVVVDTRTTCGNSVFFWCWDHMGYTCDLSKAGIFTEEEADIICNNRESDKKFIYSDCLKLVQHHVDCQDLYSKDKMEHPHTYSHLSVNKN